MPDSFLPTIVGLFVRSSDQLVERLEFASALPGESFPLGDRARVLRCHLLDTKAALVHHGVAGARIYSVASAIYQEISSAVEAHDGGDLGPWSRSRSRVAELLDELRASCPTRTATVPVPISPESPAKTRLTGTGSATGGVGDQDEQLVETRTSKGEEGKKPRPRRRSKPHGRPSMRADEYMRRLETDLSRKIRAEGLSPERELPEQLYSQTAESICEMIRLRYRHRIGVSTLKSCDVWDAWRPFRGKRSPVDSHRLSEVVEADTLSVGGCRRTAEERRNDAIADEWATSMGYSLDDDPLDGV